MRITRAGERLHFLPEWRDLVAHRDLLFGLIHRDLTVRYKRSPLGFFWTMIHPLVLMLIFVVVFSALFRFALPHYPIYFLSEYLAWNFFNQTVIQSMAGVAWNGPLMKRVAVPKSIFIVATVGSGLVNLVLSLVPLVLIMLIVGAPFHWTMLLLPIAFAVLAAFTLGVSLGLSALSVYFIDVREMYTAFSNALMYLTPIMYPLSIVPAKFRWLIKLNPLVYDLELFRDSIYYGIITTPMTLYVSFAAAIASLLIGWEIFRRLARGFHAHL